MNFVKVTKNSLFYSPALYLLISYTHYTHYIAIYIHHRKHNRKKKFTSLRQNWLRFNFQIWSFSPSVTFFLLTSQLSKENGVKFQTAIDNYWEGRTVWNLRFNNIYQTEFVDLKTTICKCLKHFSIRIMRLWPELGCRFKANFPLVGPRPTGECPPWGSF